MVLSETRMQLLRQERHPLVALAALAFFLRICLLVLATAVSPEVATASGLASLCQRSEQAPFAAHDPASCQCGPVCAHGCALGACLAPATLRYEATSRLANTGGARTVQELSPSRSCFAKAIRAPPHTLI